MLPQTNKDDRVSVEGVRRSLGLTQCWTRRFVSVLALPDCSASAPVPVRCSVPFGRRQASGRFTGKPLKHCRVTADVLTSHRADADAPWERRPLPGSCLVRLLHAGQRSTKQYCTRAQVKVLVLVRSPSLTRCTHLSPQTRRLQLSRLLICFLRRLWWTPGRWDCVGWLA